MVKKSTHTTKGLRPPKKHTAKTHAKIYWPYIPMLLLLIGGFVINIWIPLQHNHTATLAYATEMSRSGLLSATNTQRTANGKSSLTINSKLNAAAQAKAEDMVARDYWSHNTPDGKEPWVFIDAQGYEYTKAGENLAYGFSTSSATIVGWMNSPSHKANLLDGTFTEVGFGYANSSNFVSTGEETIIVAMYGTPVVAAPPAPVPAPAPAPTPSPTPSSPSPQPTSQSIQPDTTSAPAESTAEQPKEADTKDDTVIAQTEDKADSNSPVNTEAATTNAESVRITLLQQLTQGNAPWSAVAISIFALIVTTAWIAKHYILVRRFVIEGEHFVAHHPILDVAVLAIVSLVIYLSQSSGVIL